MSNEEIRLRKSKTISVWKSASPESQIYRSKSPPPNLSRSWGSSNSWLSPNRKEKSSPLRMDGFQKIDNESSRDDLSRTSSSSSISSNLETSESQSKSPHQRVTMSSTFSGGSPG